MEPIAFVRLPSITPTAIMAGKDTPPANPKTPLARMSPPMDSALSKQRTAIMAKIPPEVVNIFLLNRSAKYPMGTCRSPAIRTFIMTTVPIAELERAILVLARRGKKAQVMPMHVVKQARNAKSEKTEGIFINFIYGTDAFGPDAPFFFNMVSAGRKKRQSMKPTKVNAPMPKNEA